MLQEINLNFSGNLYLPENADSSKMTTMKKHFISLFIV